MRMNLVQFGFAYSLDVQQIPLGNLKQLTDGAESRILELHQIAHIHPCFLQTVDRFERSNVFIHFRVGLHFIIRFAAKSAITKTTSTLLTFLRGNENLKMKNLPALLRT